MAELGTRFSEGDHIEITSKNPDSFDFGTIRGVALDSRDHSGYSSFSVDVEVGRGSFQSLTFNLNFVNVKNLFRADHARSMEV